MKVGANNRLDLGGLDFSELPGDRELRTQAAEKAREEALAAQHRADPLAA